MEEISCLVCEKSLVIGNELICVLTTGDKNVYKNICMCREHAPEGSKRIPYQCVVCKKHMECSGIGEEFECKHCFEVMFTNPDLVVHKTCCSYKCYKAERGSDKKDKRMEIKAICSYCKKQDAKMLKCTSCRRAHYCDRSCQKSDWKEHRKLCKK